MAGDTQPARDLRTEPTVATPVEQLVSAWANLGVDPYQEPEGEPDVKENYLNGYKENLKIQRDAKQAQYSETNPALLDMVKSQYELLLDTCKEASQQSEAFNEAVLIHEAKNAAAAIPVPETVIPAAEIPAVDATEAPLSEKEKLRNELTTIRKPKFEPPHSWADKAAARTYIDDAVKSGIWMPLPAEQNSVTDTILAYPDGWSGVFNTLNDEQVRLVSKGGKKGLQTGADLFVDALVRRHYSERIKPSMINNMREKVQPGMFKSTLLNTTSLAVAVAFGAYSYAVSTAPASTGKTLLAVAFGATAGLLTEWTFTRKTPARKFFAGITSAALLIAATNYHVISRLAPASNAVMGTHQPKATKGATPDQSPIASVFNDPSEAKPTDNADKSINQNDTLPSNMSISQTDAVIAKNNELDLVRRSEKSPVSSGPARIIQQVFYREGPTPNSNITGISTPGESICVLGQGDNNYLNIFFMRQGVAVYSFVPAGSVGVDSDATSRPHVKPKTCPKPKTNP